MNATKTRENYSYLDFPRLALVVGHKARRRRRDLTSVLQNCEPNRKRIGWIIQGLCALLMIGLPVRVPVGSTQRSSEFGVDASCVALLHSVAPMKIRAPETPNAVKTG